MSSVQYIELPQFTQKLLIITYNPHFQVTHTTVYSYQQLTQLSQKYCNQCQLRVFCIKQDVLSIKQKQLQQIKKQQKSSIYEPAYNQQNFLDQIEEDSQNYLLEKSINRISKMVSNAEEKKKKNTTTSSRIKEDSDKYQQIKEKNQKLPINSDKKMKVKEKIVQKQLKKQRLSNFKNCPPTLPQNSPSFDEQEEEEEQLYK